MREIRVAATQMACSWDIDGNLDRAEALVRRAAADGAQFILLQELFASCSGWPGLWMTTR